ncbi:MAG TPA: alanine racemase [Acidimicrobiales bacterium]|nr:alanine racemase [Acidimicrobiales bacterium]
MTEGRRRPTRAEIDLAAVRHNAALLRRLVAPAALCAVLKADAYGHGAPAVAQAAIEGGADRVAVALVDEGIELREAGVSVPILVLSEPAADAVADAVAARLTPTLYTEGLRARVEAAARASGAPQPVQLKVDTGMHRVGAAPGALGVLARAVVDSGALSLEAIWTHLAVADGGAEEDRAFTAHQLAQFDAVVQELAAAGIDPPLRHAANTAGAVAWPASRYDLVRCGLALYGELPSTTVADAFAAASGGEALAPVLTLRSEVVAVRSLPAGARPSYGRRRPLPGPSTVATVPIGYADGVPFALFEAGGEVLIGGRRHPLAGQVTMDQLVVDCGADSAVRPGDEVVLIGRQGDERVTATEWATRTRTISYEILSRIGPRVPRVLSRPPGADPSGRSRGP